MRPPSGPVFGRPLVFFSLFGLFLLVFVVTPLWTRFPGIPARAAAWAFLVSAGFAWAWWASGPVRLPRRPVLPYFLFFLAAALSFNALAMAASIPWRGDEDHHVVFAWDLAKALADRPWYLAMPLLPLLLAFRQTALGWKTGIGALALAMAATAIALTAHLEMDNYDTWYHILRYPILLKYITAVPVYLASLLPISHLPETPYRLLPLLSAAALATLAASMLRKSPLWFRLLAGLAILTLPLVRYYSSIFYLEMPAVLCMAWAAFRADRLLRADPGRLPAMPAWYALLLVGFIKETTLPFLAAFVLARLTARFLILHRLHRRGAFRPALLFREATVLYAVCLPLFLYLFFRTYGGDPRPAGLWLNNLKDAHLALRLLHSLADSFALLLAAGLAGILLVAGRRRHLRRLVPCLFLFSAAAMSAGLHYLDDYSFIGYSRFNLFLLPSLLAFAWPALRLAESRKRPLAGAGLAVLILVNAVLSPINWDGSKKPGWGVYGVDTGEHYYPYREALGVLMARHAGEKTLLTGHYYGYLARFYTGDRNFPVQQKAGLELIDEGRRMDSTLAAASDSGYGAVLYHVLGKEYVPLKDLHGYGNVQVFKNRAHTLIMFSR